ncbi:hypothetical protein JWG41_18130 [Leptospira sp. 201903075]|uniref:hypothetical protein n=1 Tax=Leptospira chreensis TaxID=2810035 RepID=UPI0019658397|nr:hypothetical protein [Leptospira chreensis]MBM9592368.1 hypothetical protein [Leptospira chreensis]
MLPQIPLIPKVLISDFLSHNHLPLGLPDLKQYEIRSLLELAGKHVKKAEEYAEKGVTDIATAKLIYNRLVEIDEFFSKQAVVSETGLYQFKLVIIYFIQEEDDESDFTSVVGFDDDAEILNLFIKSLNSSIKPIILS